MLSISEYNIPVENRFSTLVDEGKKKDEQKTRQHEETHGITNDQDLNNTIQQQQQQHTCNQLTEHVYTKVKPSVKTNEFIDYASSVMTEIPIASSDNNDECNLSINVKVVETNYDGVLHTTSNEPINEMVETSIITQQKPNYAEVVALCPALVNNAETSKQSEASQIQLSKLVEASCSNSCDGFIGVDRKRRRYKKFFLSGIAENVKESQKYSYLSQRGIIPSVISIFKSKRRGTISAKIHVPSASSSIVLENDFWPKFVCCKSWIQKTKNKNKPLEENYST